MGSYDLLGNVILSQLGGRTRQILNLSSGLLTNLVFSAYGRKDEYEADRLGLKYMYLAGYDLNGMAQVFQFLNKASEGKSVPLILKSHPHLKDRVIAVEKEINIIESSYQ